MQYGLIGAHLPHSFSPDIHRRLADYTYELKELTPAELPGFLKSGEFSGLNVTIPYKQTVMPLLDEITPEAQAIGAVNTILRRNGRLIGDNTDFCGLRALANHAGVKLAGKTVLILGSGGTAHTARAVAQSMGAAQVACLSRTPRPGCVEEGQAAALPVQVVINATPAGMFPHPEGQAVDLTLFPRLEGVLDAVYNPLRTRLVQQAQSMGVPAEGGLYMLVAQAAAAAERFLDAPLPAQAVPGVYRDLLREKQNIVLTGMPGSGKSTVGGLLARRLGREMIDTDEAVVRRAGRDIPTIFAQEGEAGFRLLERQAIAEAAQRTGCVIATGGGAVLQEENIRLLRQNGRIYWLNRPPEQLLPTDDRPLAQTREMLMTRYAQRLPVYRSTNDVAIAVQDSAIQAADAIEKEWNT